MSRAFVLALLSLTSTCILADDGALAVGDTKLVPGACKPLVKVNETYILSAAEFKDTLARCTAIPENERGNLSVAAEVLVDVYEKISKYTCSFELSEDIEDKLVQCVKDKGGIKEFSKAEAKSHFSTNGTLDLIFGTQQCKDAGKIWDCVNNLFSKNKCSRELKGCKDNIFAGFEATSEWCDLNSPDEISSGRSNLSAYALTMGSALCVVLAKFGLFS